MPKKQKGSKAGYLFFIIFIIFIAGLVYYFAWGKGGFKKTIEEKPVVEKQTQPIVKEEVKKTEELKVKKEKEEKKQEKKKEETSQIYHSNSGFSAQAPANWKYQEISSTSVGFMPAHKTVGKGYNGDITISYKENKRNLPFQVFYDGINDVNYFEDVTSGFEKVKVAGYDGFKFKDVIGYTPSTVVIIKTETGFIEIADVYNKHQTDGIFDQILKSLKVG